MPTWNVHTDHKVSVGWQVVFIFIPFVNLWAFYRIGKLRKYLLSIFIPNWAIFLVIFVPLLSPGNASTYVKIMAYAINAAFTGFSIYRILEWSREHNVRIDEWFAKDAQNR